MVGRLLAAFLALAASGCICLTSTNPATGAPQLDLVGESNEIRYGNKADADLVASVGVIDDDTFAPWVRAAGKALAQSSERPSLPWTFRILDDPVVNAFAVPGGHVYVTRGLLAHLQNREQLSAVLAHEVAHVTARHSVEQMSRGILAGVGVGVASVVDPDGRHIGGFASNSATVMFLSHSREDELQADELAVRYLSRTQGNPSALLEVFDVLGRLETEVAHGRTLPTFLRTHPHGEERRARMEALLSHAAIETRASALDTDYLDALDGMPFGPNPREGFFIDRIFVHPDRALRMDLPPEWTRVNQRGTVLAASPEGDALVRLARAGSKDELKLANALDDFESRVGFTLHNRREVEIHDHHAVRAEFDVADEPGKGLRGWIAYVEHGDEIYQLVGLTLLTQVDRFGPHVEAWIRSFDTLRAQAALRVKPMEVRVITIERPMSLETFASAHPSVIGLQRLAILNHTDAATEHPAGARLKAVTGFNPETATKALLR